MKALGHHSAVNRAVLCFRVVFHRYGEDDVKRTVFWTLGVLVLLTGCGLGNKTSTSTTSKWKGAAYRLEWDTKAPKPSAAGITFPGIIFTANPKALERRAVLVVRFDTTGAKSKGTVNDLMIMTPFDISGVGGNLPADYVERADYSLAKILTGYCMKGKIKMNVALVRSSLNPQAKLAEIEAKRLSDWLPIELDFKNPKGKC